MTPKVVYFSVGGCRVGWVWVLQYGGEDTVKRAGVEMNVGAGWPAVCTNMYVGVAVRSFFVGL